MDEAIHIHWNTPTQNKWHQSMFRCYPCPVLYDFLIFHVHVHIQKSPLFWSAFAFSVSRRRRRRRRRRQYERKKRKTCYYYTSIYMSYCLRVSNLASYMRPSCSMSLSMSMEVSAVYLGGARDFQMSMYFILFCLGWFLIKND